jgi:excisionase family DNA binding protein
MQEPLYTPTEVAEYLKVTRQAVYKWMKQGRLGFVLVGADRRVPESALTAFIRSGNTSSEGDAEKNEAPGVTITA